MRVDGRQVRDGLRVAEGHARSMYGVIGWWGLASFGLVGVLFALLTLLWPAPVRTLGGVGVGAWLLVAALGRGGGGLVLRGRYGGPLLLQAAGGLLAGAGAVVLELPALSPAAVAATAGLAVGIAAAVDAGVAAQFPALGRRCLHIRAGVGLVAAITIAAAPLAGLAVAAAAVGLAEVLLAVLLLPEVERLAAMDSRDGSVARPALATDEGVDLLG
jgi:hypothetical protein